MKTLLLILCLSSDDYKMREEATALLSRHGVWASVDRALHRSACPEARQRLHRIRGALTIREIDRYDHPAADDLDWPEEEGVCPHFPEFYRAFGFYTYDGEVPTYSDPDQRARTREALARYVNRTGDWATVYTILCGAR